MKKFKKNSILLFILNSLVILVLLALPYFLFGGKLFIGGDDTRLFYIYPLEWFKQISFFSWFNFSSVGRYNPNQFLLPLLLVIGAVKTIVFSKIVTHYFFFSLPLIVGFIYFQKLFGSIVEKSRSRAPAFVGALLYISSPILIVSELSKFLYDVWLIALFPIIIFYFIRYVRTNKIIHIFICSVWSTMFALALFSFPWLLGALIPIFLGLVFSLFVFTKAEIWTVIKKGIVFFGIVLFSQSFWLIPFSDSLVNTSQTSVANMAVSSEISDTFTPTVLATSKGTILYPLLNLFHRQIAFDYNWTLKDVFLAFYDKIIFINAFFILIFFFGLFYSRTYLHGTEQKLYSVGLLSLLFSLFFFTVNIGPLKDIFLALGNIPGFVMFRNPYDKFAFGYIFLYALVLAFSVLIMGDALKKFKKTYAFFISLICILIVINVLPIKRIINKPLWTTKNISTTTHIPDEYLSFMAQVKNTLSPMTNIFSVPFGEAAYSFIKEEGSNNVFAGTSPVKLFTGINDFSGILSFPQDASTAIKEYIVNRNYEKLKNLFSIYNIKYFFETKNIPSEVLGSYLFNTEVLQKQDQEFKDSLFGEKILSSTKNNYSLYDIAYENNEEPSIITFARNIYAFEQGISPEEKVKYNNSVFGILNAQNVLIDNPVSSEYIQYLSPVRGDRAISLGSGNYDFYINSDVFYLNFEPWSNTVVATGNYNFKLDNTLHSTIKKYDIISLDQYDVESLYFGINGNVVELSKLINYEVSAYDELVLFTRENTNVIELGTIAATWGQGDCNSYNTDKAVFFDFSGNVDEEIPESIRLRSLNNHNACLYSKFNIEKGATYKLDFDYRTNGDDIKVYIDFGDGTTVTPKQKVASEEWKHFSYSLSDTGSNAITLYLYSGQKEKATAFTEFKNIELYKYTATQSIDLSNFLKNEEKIDFSVEGDKKFILPFKDDAVYEFSDMSEWNTGDCAAVDAIPSVFFNNVKARGEIELTSLNGHNACIYKEFVLNKNHVYTLSFKYIPYNHDKLTVYVEYGDSIPPFVYKKAISEKQQNSVALEIKPPRRAQTMKVYLYSGINNKGRSATRYKNIALHEFPQNFYNNLLIREADKKRDTQPTVEVKKINNAAYKVTFISAEEDFVFNFLESYHKGWNVYSTDGTYRWYSTLFQKALPLAHYKANNYSNAWYVDVKALCSIDSTCIKNTQGTYTIDLILEFTPQKYFYLGLALTILTLFGLSSYSVYQYIENRSPKKKKKRRK